MIAVQLTFTPTDERLSARPAHREVLEQLKADGTLLGAGPWADDSGALLIFHVDRQSVDQLLENDPYYAINGVIIDSIRNWKPIVGPA